jgi:hypothetical protein
LQIITLFAIFDRYIAVVIAVFPPPTTKTSLSLQKDPSHIAQKETPLPINSEKLSRFNFLGCVPVATITDLNAY